MKKLLSITFISLLICITFTGCTTTRVIPNVNTTKYVDKGVYIPVPSQYLAHCDVATKPIDKVAYLAATPEARELVWHDYSASLINDIKNCNVRVDALRQYNADEVKLFSNGAVATGDTTTVTNTDAVPATTGDIISKAATPSNIISTAAHLLGGGFIEDIVKGISGADGTPSITPATTTTTTVVTTKAQ